MPGSGGAVHGMQPEPAVMLGMSKGTRGESLGLLGRGCRSPCCAVELPCLLVAASIIRAATAATPTSDPVQMWYSRLQASMPARSSQEDPCV